MRISTFILVFLILVSPCHARIIYVDANTPDNNDGSSWALAYKYLQDALYKPPSGGDQIWVAAGSYYPDEDEGANVDPNDRTETFQLINGVAIYGGYAGFWAPDPNERNIELHETILSGDINTPGDNSDNSYHVTTGSGTDANGVLDGFTITAGNANGSGTQRTGGGMYNWASSPTVTNCTFSGNSSASIGGGMLNHNGSSPTVTNCTFSGNSANSSGGGMYNWSSSNTTLVNCTFSGNSATRGGGMCNDRGNPTVTNCILWGNAPAGPQIYNYSSTPTVTYSDIAGGYTGTGNIDTDPCFADPYNGDYHLKSQAGRYEPNSQSWIQDDVTSPCIDAGDPNSPIGNERFPNGGRVNMGAYGATHEASKSFCGDRFSEEAIAADINGDCIVNWKDFAIMALYWLEDNRE
ncbi:MAG: right-handed parallel beta-helix repeat-containing protein [Planctomycetota bacterium]